MTAPRLTMWDQALINVCGWLVCAGWSDPNRELMVGQARRLVPHVNHENLMIGPLAEAAQSVCDHADKPSSMELLAARHALENVLATVFMARGSAALALCWPAENTAPDAPAPEALPTETANAAERS